MKKKTRYIALEAVKGSCRNITCFELFEIFGISKQAYYKHKKSSKNQQEKDEKVIEMVLEIREKHPRMGGKKLYHMLKPRFKLEGIKKGRDMFFTLLAENGLLIRRSNRKSRKSRSSGLSKYPNLIKNTKNTARNQLWVCDITYWPNGKGFWYVSLVTDAYSRKILGFKVSESLGVEANIEALSMALRAEQKAGRSIKGLIHHSDQGQQYCCHSYIDLLKNHDIKVSMSAQGCPHENAIAERTNGIIKNEYLFQFLRPKNFKGAEKLLAKSVYLYNEKRPHFSCSLYTPSEVHDQQITPERLWKYEKQEYEKSTKSQPISGLRKKP